MVSPVSVSLPRLPAVVEVGRCMHARDPRVIQATHQRVGQMGQIGTKCVLEGRSGRASVFAGSKGSLLILGANCECQAISLVRASILRSRTIAANIAVTVVCDGRCCASATHPTRDPLWTLGCGFSCGAGCVE